jgi:sn-glycerol 3-phosphate transport system ATP-binding protein
MNAGHIEQIGTPAEIYHQPATRFVAGFIGAPPMNLLPASLAGGAARLASGLAVPLGAEWAGAAEAAVELGIRPEDVVIAPPGEGVPFTVEFLEELGAGRLAHGMVEGADFIVALAPGAALSPGERCGLHLPPAALHLFDAGTGRRYPLRPATSSSTGSR